MATGRIPRDFIDELLTRVDIVDVINTRVPLKKKGHEYTACCPFHNEKTPSFTVSQEKQFYHCFGCGVHGSAISFLMEYEHLEFVEAIESLAASQGMEVRREGGAGSFRKTRVQKGILSLLADADQYYQLQLKASEPAINYLKDRGLSGEICKRYHIGYAPEGWQTIENQFAQQYSKQDLINSGLVIQKDDGKTYDRYRGRIQFPIRNRKGDVIGFGGRVLGDELPKYINSPETEVFHKGRELYGLYEARKFERKLERIVVVEGYMDVIALAQYDINYAVATLGTATTQEHINILFRTVAEIIFCFDGDRAGREAAWRALNNACEVIKDGKEIRFLFLPDGEDPDTQVRKIGREAFEAAFAQAQTLTQFFIENLHQQFNISSAEGKNRYIQEAAKLLKKMPDTLIREQLIDDIARLTGVARQHILDRQLTDGSVQDPAVLYPGRVNQREVKQTPVRYAISLLLHRPEFAEAVNNLEKISASNLAGSEILTTLIETIQVEPELNAAMLLERWRDTEFSRPLAQLMRWSPETDDVQILNREFKDCLKKIAQKTDENQIEFLLHKERSQGLNDTERRDLADLLQRKHAV